MHNSVRTQAIVEGALLAALTAILGLAGIYLPFLRLVIDFLWTIPIVVITVRHGLRVGMITLSVAGVLIVMLAHPLSAFFLILQFGGLALFYGAAFREKWRPAATLFVGTGIAVLSFLLVLALLVQLTGFEALNFAEQMEASIEPTIELYRQLGLFKQGAQTGVTETAVREMLTALTQTAILLIPAFFVLWALATAFLNYLIAQQILGKLKIRTPVLPPFRRWQLPWWLVWGFIFGFAAYLIGDYFALEKLVQIGMNIILIYAPILFILGLAVASFYLGKYVKGTMARVFLIFLVIFFFRFLFLALMAVGLLDLLFDYRNILGR